MQPQMINMSRGRSSVADKYECCNGMSTAGWSGARTKRRIIIYQSFHQITPGLDSYGVPPSRRKSAA